MKYLQILPKLIIFLFSIITRVYSIIPGMPLVTYKKDDSLKITVGKLNSIQTQFPFGYYYLPVCFQKNHTRQAENLGEILTGDYTYSTHYEAFMGKDEYCKTLCTRKIKNAFEENIFQWMIERNYTTSWYLDSLPAGLNYTYINQGVFSERVIHDAGIPIGEIRVQDSKPIIYNHLTFQIFVNKNQKADNPYTIVEFNIIPWSLNHPNETHKLCATNEKEYASRHNYQPLNPLNGKLDEEIVYTYDIVFYESKMKWTSRWDHHMLSSKEDNIHWISFINSTLIILIFTALLAHIFSRALKRDIEYINSRAISDDVFDDRSWKQVSRDVFRKPRFSMLLCVLVGTGIQLFVMFLVTIVCGAIGFIYPGNRGSLLTLMLLAFIFMGGIAGYWSARFYKMFMQMDWLKNALFTAFLYPSLAFTIFSIINIFLIFEESSGAVPFSTIIALLVLWICCSSPLVLIGAFIGIKKKQMKNPGKVNVVPSSIPPQPWYLELKLICLIAGVLPFGAIFIELVYIMGSIWKHYFYYLFGFILIVVVIMIITSSEISMVIAYFQLSKGDYRWWWKSFFVSGSVAIYIFAYSVYYYLTALQITRFSSIILYFGYMFLISFTAFLISGSIGFVSTYFFLKKIYSMIKID